jgi:hypothetical protein
MPHCIPTGYANPQNPYLQWKQAVHAQAMQAQVMKAQAMQAGQVQAGQVEAGQVQPGQVQAGQVQAGGTLLRIPDQEVSVWIDGAAGKVTKHFCFANDMADVFGIDTSVIPDFDEGALIEKVVQGAPDVQGKWNVCSVIMAFAPNLYSRLDHAKRAIAKTSIADYPSRKEVQMMHANVS